MDIAGVVLIAAFGAIVFFVWREGYQSGYRNGYETGFFKGRWAESKLIFEAVFQPVEDKEREE